MAVGTICDVKASGIICIHREARLAMDSKINADGINCGKHIVGRANCVRGRKVEKNNIGDVVYDTNNLCEIGEKNIGLHTLLPQKATMC